MNKYIVVFDSTDIFTRYPIEAPDPGSALARARADHRSVATSTRNKADWCHSVYDSTGDVLIFEENGAGSRYGS